MRSIVFLLTCVSPSLARSLRSGFNDYAKTSKLFNKKPTGSCALFTAPHALYINDRLINKGRAKKAETSTDLLAKHWAESIGGGDVTWSRSEIKRAKDNWIRALRIENSRVPPAEKIKSADCPTDATKTKAVNRDKCQRKQKP